VTRREFFKTTGRGTLAVGGVALLGTGLSIFGTGCGGGDSTAPNQY